MVQTGLIASYVRAGQTARLAERVVFILYDYALRADDRGGYNETTLDWYNLGEHYRQQIVAVVLPNGVIFTADGVTNYDALCEIYGAE